MVSSIINTTLIFNVASTCITFTFTMRKQSMRFTVFYFHFHWIWSPYCHMLYFLYFLSLWYRRICANQLGRLALILIVSIFQICQIKKTSFSFWNFRYLLILKIIKFLDKLSKNISTYFLSVLVSLHIRFLQRPAEQSNS